jgi:hypothetical protein
MKKHVQYLMLSAVVLSTAQGVAGTSGAEEAKTVSSVVNQKQSFPKVSVTLKKLPEKNSGQPFKDISCSIFKNYIHEIYKIEITTGYTPTTFKPENKVIRGEMAVAGGKASTSGKYVPKVSDAKKHMFVNDIGWLYAEGITDAAKAFQPDSDITRGEMAVFLFRFYKKFNTQSQSTVDKTSLKVKDSTLYVGDAWQSEDNFVSATDKNGKAIAFSQVKVNGTVDTSKEGTTKITYTYGGKTATAQLIVDANMPALSADGSEV